MLDVNQLHTAEVYKLLLKSKIKATLNRTLNGIFDATTPAYTTRRTTHGKLNIPRQRTQFMQKSLKTKIIKLYNNIVGTDLLPEVYTSDDIGKLIKIFKYKYLIYDSELARNI